MDPETFKIVAIHSGHRQFISLKTVKILKKTRVFPEVGNLQGELSENSCVAQSIKKSIETVRSSSFESVHSRAFIEEPVLSSECFFFALQATHFTGGSKVLLGRGSVPCIQHARPYVRMHEIEKFENLFTSSMLPFLETFFNFEDAPYPVRSGSAFAV